MHVHVLYPPSKIQNKILLTQENKENYRAVVFEESHPVQVEYAGIPSVCNKCEEAQLFLDFLVSEAAQKIIFEKNYMLPINKKALESVDFQLPKNLKTFSTLKSWSRIRNKKKWIEKWKKIFY